MIPFVWLNSDFHLIPTKDQDPNKSTIKLFSWNTEFWEEENTEIGHIELADWADVVLVAPATADFLARVSCGMAGDPLSAIILATKAPLLFAPAMNVNMWEHPTTIENVTKLKGQGIEFVEPEVGALACGWNGSGRLADPWDIFHCTLRRLSESRGRSS